MAARRWHATARRALAVFAAALISASAVQALVAPQVFGVGRSGGGSFVGGLAAPSSGLSSSSSKTSRVQSGRPPVSGHHRLEETLAATTTVPPPADEEEEDTLPPLKWSPEGESRWAWRTETATYETHYVVRRPNGRKKTTIASSGGQRRRRPVVLVHGFGANFYHWRYTAAALAEEGYEVFALDLLGFGLSEKPTIPYAATTWSEQVAAFIREVVKEPAAVVGNSLGGYTALATKADHPSLVLGVGLLNAAGRFRSPDDDDDDDDVKEAAQTTDDADLISTASRAATNLLTSLFFKLSFEFVRRPARIAQVLRQVYAVDDANVDDDLVESIAHPARDARAADVYPLVITRPGGKGRYVDDLLEAVVAADQTQGRPATPLLLAWGVQDPWIRPAAADRIVDLYAQFQQLATRGTAVGSDDDLGDLGGKRGGAPAAEETAGGGLGVGTTTTPSLRRVDLLAGHCPHDEKPHETNAALLHWLDTDVRWDSTVSATQW